jgi:hypothetical protein
MVLRRTNLDDVDFPAYTPPQAAYSPRVAFVIFVTFCSIFFSSPTMSGDGRDHF